MLRRVVRFLIRTAILVAANAVGLLVAAAVLDDMTVDGTSFIEAIIIFTVAVALMTPFMANALRKRQSSALGGVALIATLISLVITDLISDGFTIEGIWTWVAATVIVWAASLLAAFILPYLGLKKYLEDRDSR
jgi:MFS family permease